jgi:hypothetical protein
MSSPQQHGAHGSESRQSDLATLSTRWREEAERLRTLEAHGQAAALEVAATELEAAAAQGADETLTIREAAAESGYSGEHLRRLVRKGELPVQRNGGPRSRIYVRRGDLPTKRRSNGRDTLEGVAYDPAEDARDIAKIMGGIT